MRASARPPAPRRRSLRAKLLWWLVPALVCIMFGTLWMSNSLLREQVDTAYDRSLAGALRAIDLNISTVSGGLAMEQPYMMLEFFQLTAAGQVYFRVATEDGLAEIGNPVLPLPARALVSGEPQFYDAEYMGEPVRVAALARPMDPPLAGDPHGRVVVQVAEGLRTRETFIESVLVRSIERDVVGIAISVLLLVLGVMISLRPLGRLRQEIEGRRADDLRPLDEAELPSEVLPLVQALNRHMDRYAAQSRVQQQFLDDASHQLRTPLSVLRTQVAYALREQDPEELRAAVAAMDEGLERAVRMTNQMLALARARDASIARERLLAERVELNELADGVMRAMLPAARARRLDCGLDPAASPVIVAGADWMLREALSNLVDNAIRYSPLAGRLTIEVDAANGIAVVAVEDEGAGMSSEDIARAGLRFRRGEAGKRKPGAGLGLAIVKTIVEMHGGRLALLPRAPRGLRAELHLPLADPLSGLGDFPRLGKNPAS